MSLPLRECGLKSATEDNPIESVDVTPLAGVWVEIVHIKICHNSPYVTPLAGVWVEIDGCSYNSV